jgi:hypothetical protein
MMDSPYTLIILPGNSVTPSIQFSQSVELAIVKQFLVAAVQQHMAIFLKNWLLVPLQQYKPVTQCHQSICS